MQTDNIEILVAEDEEELLKYLVEYLQIFFPTVYSATCGEEAYKIYLDKKPSIILSDINMPNLDGLSMISRIREKNRDNDTKIIVMSAHSDREKLLQAVELNLVTYLIKPIKFETLKKVLVKLVNSINSSNNKIYLKTNTYWDVDNNKLYSFSNEIVLKEKESMLMQFLCSNLNSPVSSISIFNKLYANSNKEFSEYAITSLVKRLRAKIPDNIIQNEYGVGYKITSTV